MHLLTDDPSRTADFGYFSRERVQALKITADMLAESVETGRELWNAPFSEWVPLVYEGWVYAPPTLESCIHNLKAWLASSDTRYVGDAMDVLSDIAYKLYGDSDE